MRKPELLKREQIQEGRQILLRVEIQTSRYWADALTLAHERGVARELPFGEVSWYETVRTIRELRRGGKLSILPEKRNPWPTDSK